MRVAEGRALPDAAASRDPLQVLLRFAREKGDCFVYLAGKPQSFLVNRPTFVRHVLVDRTADYSKDTPANAGFAAHVAEGLLTSEGAEWRDQRSLMQPYFARRNIPAFARIVNRMVAESAARWEDTAAGGEDINLSAEVSQLLFRITALGLFHVDTARWGSRPTELLAAALPFVGRRHSHPTIRAARISIRELAEAVVAERRDSRDGLDDIVTSLIAPERGEVDPAVVRDHVVTLALAGYTTTASVVAWACYLLATMPDVAAGLRAAISEVTGGRPLTLEDLQSLPYLTATIRETMRLYPPAWIIGRRALRDDLIGDTSIPAGSIVAVSPYVLHRHPAYWPDPETFDPQRFMSAREERDREPFSYIPFGAGPRTCIGANFALVEAPLIVGLLTQRFHMTLANDTRIRPHGMFVLMPRPAIRMSLAPLAA